MIKVFLIIFSFLYSINCFGLEEDPPGIIAPHLTAKADTLERQILYNGRVWQNQFFNTDGNQFFLSSEFSAGSVEVDGYNFNNVKIKYDLYNDELLIQKDDGTIIQLNKEMINSFTIPYYEKTFRFVNFDNEPEGYVAGYCQLLYDGDIKIYVKILKELIPTTISNGLPKFTQVNKIYIVKDGKFHRTDNRKKLLNLFAEEEQVLIKKFIRSNQIVISRNDPETYSRVIGYYETKAK